MNSWDVNHGGLRLASVKVGGGGRLIAGSTSEVVACTQIEWPSSYAKIMWSFYWA